MVKHTRTIRRLLPTNSLSVFDHVVGLALKGSKLELTNGKHCLKNGGQQERTVWKKVFLSERKINQNLGAMLMLMVSVTTFLILFP